MRPRRGGWAVGGDAQGRPRWVGRAGGLGQGQGGPPGGGGTRAGALKDLGKMTLGRLSLEGAGGGFSVGGGLEVGRS